MLVDFNGNPCLYLHPHERIYILSSLVPTTLRPQEPVKCWLPTNIGPMNKTRFHSFARLEAVLLDHLRSNQMLNIAIVI